MMRINQTTDQAWIEPKDVDRYWHLPPLEMKEGHHQTVPPQTLKVRRIRRAQFAAIGTVICRP